MWSRTAPQVGWAVGQGSRRSHDPASIRTVPSTLLFAFTCLCTLPQDPTPGAADIVSARERFQTLTNLRKAMVVRGLEQRLLSDPDPLLQRILAFSEPLSDVPEARPKIAHDPERYAKGVAPTRRLIGPDDPAHVKFATTLPDTRLLPDLRKAVVYDWGEGRIVSLPEPLGFDDLYENMLRGYPPGADVALARVQATLDDQAKERPIAAYLDHLYADLDARVYQGITLYDAWASGRQVDVPDVDAIPFALLILKDRSFRSPIPADARRAALYEKIKTAAVAHRTYRTWREAAAAAFIAAQPPMDQTYAPLVPRFHYLFAVLGDDPKALKQVLAKAGDRDLWIAQMDALLSGSKTERDRRDQRARQMSGMAHKIQRMAIAAVER